MVTSSRHRPIIIRSSEARANKKEFFLQSSTRPREITVELTLSLLFPLRSFSIILSRRKLTINDRLLKSGGATSCQKSSHPWLCCCGDPFRFIQLSKTDSRAESIGDNTSTILSSLHSSNLASRCEEVLHLFRSLDYVSFNFHGFNSSDVEVRLNDIIYPVVHNQNVYMSVLNCCSYDPSLFSKRTWICVMILAMISFFMFAVCAVGFLAIVRSLALVWYNIKL